MKVGMFHKGKWIEKTVGAMREDCNRHEGVCVGYGACFYDHFTEDEDMKWSFAIRLGHDREYMDEDQKKRLEKAFEYIMAGVQKIFNMSIQDLEDYQDIVKVVKWNQ